MLPNKIYINLKSELTLELPILKNIKTLSAVNNILKLCPKIFHFTVLCLFIYSFIYLL